MYFWNIKALVASLSEQPLGELNSLKYLIASIVLFELPMLIPFGGRSIWETVSPILMAFISVIGTIYCYKKNGASGGTFFLQKYLAIGWVVAIRWLPLLLGLFIMKSFISISMSEGNLPPTALTWHDTLLLAVMSMAIYISTGRYISVVKQNEQRVKVD